jgi:hypothetical protein
MALKEYEWHGSTWLFDESDAPDGAVEVKSKPNKARTPRNK